MDPITAISITATVISLIEIPVRFCYTAILLIRRDGLTGLLYLVFGSRTTWRSEAHVLGTVNDRIASEFKKSVQDECSMVSVAAAIVAQISISAYGLDNMNRTHWLARGFFIFGLVTSLMAVYYATTLHRVMGRQLEPASVRTWIRGFRLRRSQKLYEKALRLDSDPSEFDRELLLGDQAIDRCFRPAYATVLTLSAPQVLLSTSLFSLLIGIGVYLGFMWTSHIDENFGRYDSRNIWIVYLITAVTSVLVYSTSRLITDDERIYEERVLSDYRRKWVKQHLGVDLGSDPKVAEGAPPRTVASGIDDQLPDNQNA